jgi:hypothetical protein
LKEKTFGKFRRACEIQQEFASGESARGFITVDRSKDSDANGIAAVRSTKREAREGIFFATDFECAELAGLNALRATQRFEKGLNRATSIFNSEMFGHHLVYSLQVQYR